MTQYISTSPSQPTEASQQPAHGQSKKTFRQVLTTPFSRTLRRVAGLVSCGAITAMGLVNPAMAANHELWLYDGDSTTLSGYFLEGERIYGDCDEDCYDLDLHLYSTSGSLVDSDIELDSYPIVSAPYDGYFEVEVSMPSCDHGSGCAASVNSDYGF